MVLCNVWMGWELIFAGYLLTLDRSKFRYSPFCVPAKVTKLIGLKRPPFLSPTNLIIFACTQNGE
jgi:hypothetical protein